MWELLELIFFPPLYILCLLGEGLGKGNTRIGVEVISKVIS